jgi:hypothetical protein
VFPKKFQEQSSQVAFQSGEEVPMSGIWQPDHYSCACLADMWLRANTSFPPCSDCGSAARFVFVQEILHISEDPDFQ